MPSPSLLIDASIYIFQYYFALPDNWYSEDEGWPTAAVYGYTTFLVRLLDEQRPQRIAACFDESLESGFRHTLYPGYKASRALPDETLAFQLQACRDVTELLGIHTFGSETYEADDLIGSLSQRLQRSQQPIAILTRDKDLGQLIRREQDFLWDYAADKSHYAGDIQQKFGVQPRQLSDYLALVGDVSDDIPGVPGVGGKTAQQLLQAYPSVELLLAKLDGVAALPIRGANNLGNKLADYREQIILAKQLATIVTDLPLINSVTELMPRSPSWKKLDTFCQAMGFPKLFQRIKTLQNPQ